MAVLDEMRENLLAYLQKPAFARLWPMVREKYKRLSRLGGKVTLSPLDGEERTAIAELLSINLHGQNEVDIYLKQLDEALRQTRFEASLEDCMELLYSGDFVSNRQQRETEAVAWDEFCDWALGTLDSRRAPKGNDGTTAGDPDTNSADENQTEVFAGERIAFWVRNLSSGKGVGYRTFRECYEEYRSTGHSLVWSNTIRALTQLPTDRGDESWPLRLPIFAAEVTGDAHGLDRTTPTGRMFYWGLMALRDDKLETSDDDGSRAEMESDSESVRSLYFGFGLALDDISSIVWVAGLPEIAEAPVALTLWSVQRLDLADAPRFVFVVENPSVFGALIDEAGTTPLPYPIVCPSGQPSVAALRFLDKIAAAGGTIFYSGDFDVTGLLIAASLANRYGIHFVPWRLSSKDYLRYLQGRGALQRFMATETQRLRQMELPWEEKAEEFEEGALEISEPGTDDAEISVSNKPELGPGADVRAELDKLELPQIMAEQGVKIFQEHFVDDLCADYWSTD